MASCRLSVGVGVATTFVAAVAPPGESVACAVAIVAAGEGVPVLCYTVNDATRARTLFDLGAAAVFSDAPDRIWPVVQ